jgi:hypothetical protein
MYPESVKLDIFIIPVLHGRLEDIYITHWHSSVNICSSLFLLNILRSILAGLNTETSFINVLLDNVIHARL